MNQRLRELCERDEIIALRDEAKRAAEKGDWHAEIVWRWMERELTRLASLPESD